ncbi:MAG: hypothetical protein A2017_14050 [Lentisphaerae bacterium GWF2_44_16]|nr:MAG: hypothetical protein A2017_14050 [Lentisphaerae bacterium GWF2_44_16]
MNIEKFQPPLNDELLKKYNFFELYPFDGGGCFIHREIVGTVDDNEIYERIINQNALSDFGKLPGLEFDKFERWRSIEKSCWINRFYFIVPLAKKYWLMKDEAIAIKVKNTILHFIRNFSPPPTKDAVGEHQKRVFYNRDTNYNSKSYEEYSKDETDVEYIWFDFQPASRIIHFLYAFYFLKNSSSISGDEWKEFENSIDEHAKVIMYGEKYFSKLAKGNHQSLRGLALLFAATFLQNKEYLEEGLRICSYHICNDFLDDGVLHEISPSYHIFETWHVRDAYLLSNARGFNLSCEAESILNRAGNFAKALSQPDGKSTVINDGYALSLDAFIASLPENETVAEDISASFFKNAGLAFFRDSSRYLLFDVSPFTGPFSHYHSGKNAFTYWYKGIPFFIDSACCNYDDPLFAEWYKKTEAHSSLIIDGKGDGTLNGTYEWREHAKLSCNGWIRNENDFTIKSALSSSVCEWSDVSWTRSIELKKENTLIITDMVKSETSKQLEFVFNLHPDVNCRIEAGNISLVNGNVKLQMIFSQEQVDDIRILKGRSFIDFRHRENQRVSVLLHGTDKTLRTEIREI